MAEVVGEVKRYVSCVVVVDDCSTDGTAGAARTAGAEVLTLARNSGKGAALRAGWQRARELGRSWALMLDGDGQHVASDIATFFRAAETTGSRLIVGNRMNDCGAMPWLRRQVNQWMSRRLSRLAGAPLPDSQCGFRLAHLETLSQISMRANRFEIESDMLMGFCRSGRNVEFVPIQTIYRTGASKINVITDTYRWMRWRLDQEREGGPYSRERLEVRPEVNGIISP